MANSSGAEMPFLDHLEELRWRLIWSLAALAIGIVIGFALMWNDRTSIIGLLEQPILPYLAGRKLVYTHPGDPFSILLKAAFAIGFVLALPVILYQLWAFLSPALYRHEKRVIIPVLIGAAVLFAAGVALAFFVVLPVTLRFLLGLHVQSLEPMITAGDYFGFVIGMSLAFGAVFEMPIAILALTALGIVTPQMLRRFRRHAIVLCAVGSAFITPGGDPLSLMALFFPLYFLFELSIWLSALLFRRREERREAEAAREATA
jgi:sec-independent protein translocase protein TatC